MFNIIKADLYRIFRSGGVYVTIVVFLAFLLLQTFSMGQGTIGVDIESLESPEQFTEITADSGESVMMYTPAETAEFTGSTAPFELATSTDNLIYFMLPFIVFIAAADFSHGTVKNMISGGAARRKYYFSKIILTAGACVAIWLIYLVLPIIIATVWRGFGGDFNGAFIRDVLKIYLPQLYLLFTYSCIGVFLAFTFKRTAALNTVYIAFSIVPMLFIYIIVEFIDKAEKLIQYDLVFNLKTFAYPTGELPPDLTRTLLLGAVYILGCTVGGIALFRKSEIK